MIFKKRINTVTFLLVTLGLVFFVIFHFLKNDSQNMSKISSAIQVSLEIKQLDIQLNEDALEASHFKLLHFDGIVKNTKQLTEKISTLHQRIDQVRPIAGYSLEPIHDRLNQSIKERIQLVEKMKSSVALARNSSNYLLSALANFDEDIFLKAALKALNEVQGYKIYPTIERFESARKAVDEFSDFVAQHDQLSEEKSNLLRHLEISFFETQRIDEFLKELLASESLDQINQLIVELNNINVRHQSRSTSMGYGLLALTFIIFVAFAFALIRLGQARDKTIKTGMLFEEAVESMTEGFAFFNPDNKLVFSNSKFKEIYKDVADHLQVKMELDDFEKLIKDQNIVVREIDQLDGSKLEELNNGRWILSSTTPMQTGGHALVRIDITQQKKAESDLRLAATVFDNAGEAMMVTDSKNIICKINTAFSEITGYPKEEVLGKTPGFLNSGYHDTSFFKEMYADLKLTGKWQGEIWNRRKNGEIYPEWLSISTIYNRTGGVRQRVALFTDITNRKKSEERIYHQANFDTITDLPNRNLFADRFRQAISRAERENKRIALLFLDLDNFKYINDTFGHQAGDELLRQVAERLYDLINTSDTVAHISGDEFAILITEAERNLYLEQVIKKILDRLSEPFLIEENTTYTSGSIGVTFYPDDGEQYELLMQNADTAMFRAKDTGRNTYCFFTPEMNERAQERHDLEIALHEAIEEEHFVLHYQPIVDPVSLTVISTECLVRWNDPERGMVSPAKFIPVAEDTGLIVPIGEWILKQACKDAAHWIKEKKLNVGVSVNLSSRQFGRCDMVQLVKDSLADSGLPPTKLTLEITESLLVDDDQGVLNTLRTIRDMGVLLSIDDFGTGYSSLSYLKKFPLTTLKIDQSFISGVLDNSEDSALTEAILSMAASLNLKVVAEGVENSGQAAFLLERQCDMIQGYYYSRPLPVDELLAAFAEEKLVA